MNHLPPEIIALCAAFASDADPKQTVLLTHVCQYWREAITSSPRNWTSISSGWKRLTPLFLKRAGAAPLAANLSVLDIEDNEDFIQALTPHVPRISRLSLTGYSFIEDVADRLPSFFASPILNFTSLELEQDRRRPAESFPSNEDLEPPLFQNVSKLKSLHLTRVPLYPTLSSVVSLVELKLIDYTVPFGAFIGFLQSNVALEVVISGLGIVRASVLTASGRRVSLPRLRRLILTCDDAIDTRGLLSCLSLPSGVNTEIHSSERDSYGDLASFLPYTPTPIQDLLAPITTMKYKHYPRQLHLSNAEGSFSFCCDGWGISPTVYGEFGLFATGAVREFHLSFICEGEGTVDQLSWALKRLPALEALAISASPLRRKLLSVLTKKPVPCPSLKTIAFISDKVDWTVIKELGEMVKEREHSVATRLHRVVIANRRNFPEGHTIRSLQKLVPRVDIIMGDELPNLL